MTHRVSFRAMAIPTCPARSPAARTTTFLLLAAALAALPAESATAQRVLDPLGDASLPRPGQVRVGLGGRWDWFDSQLAATPGGARIPLGDGVIAEPLGDRFGGFVRGAVRRLANDTTLPVTAGVMRGGIEARNWAVPVVLEVGITRWLAVQATVPVVQPFTSVFLRPNPVGTFADLGANPASRSDASGQAARTAATQAITQLLQAGTAIRQARPECFAASPGAACGPVIAAEARAADMALGVTQAFTAGRPFAPLAGSRADSMIAVQFAAFNATVRSITGATIDPVTARPVFAAARMGFADFQAMVLGAGFDTLGSRRRILMGDASAGVIVKLFDTFGRTDSARIAASGVRVRSGLRVLGVLGTGQVPVARQWVDQGSGTDGTALDVRWTTDLLASRRFWMSVAVQGRQWADETMPAGVVMVSDGTTPFGTPPGGVTTMPIVVDPTARWMRRRGLERTLDVVPRFVLNDFVSFQAAWRWRSRDDDTFTARGAVADFAGDGRRPAGLDGLLSRGGSEQRLGIGVTFSTVAAKRKERRGVPVEVSYLHQQVIAGTNLPRMTSDAVQLRWYWPVRH